MKNLLLLALIMLTFNSFAQITQLKKKDNNWVTENSYDATVYVTLSDKYIVATISYWGYNESKLLKIDTSYYNNGWMIYKCTDPDGKSIRVSKKGSTIIAKYKSYGYRANNCHIKRPWYRKRKN